MLRNWKMDPAGKARRGMSAVIFIYACIEMESDSYYMLIMIYMKEEDFLN